MLMWRALVLAGLFCVTLSNSGQALYKRGDFWSKNLDPGDLWFDMDDLLKACTSTDERSKSLCIGYVIATADSFNVGGKVWRSCIPKGTDVQYVIKIIVDDLNKHRWMGYVIASDYVADVLRNNFPCPPQR